jgi:hypothetical protein
MEVKVRLLLKDGHVAEFCCHENDSILFGLVSALPGSEFRANLPPDGLIQVEVRKGKRLFLTRSSLVAVQTSPLNSAFKSPEELQEPRRSSQKSSRVIDFAVTTVARPGEYIHQLISNVRDDLPLRLVVGSPEREYLKKYTTNSHIDFIETTPAEWDRFRDCSVHRRATWNYWRALTFGVRSSSRKGLVVLEDDVVPIDDWESRLYDLIEEIEARGSGAYILSLYAAAESGLKSPEDGTRYVWCPPHDFFGSQAIYYPESLREKYSKYLKQHGVEEFSIPYDLLLGDYSKKENIPIYAAIPCLVDHIGEVSTGLAGFFHKAIQLELE